MVYGITGYIGSGKSVAAKYMEAKGFTYISADKIVDKLYESGGEGYKKIYNFFGDQFILKNGGINRRKLARFVFSDANKLKFLNNLIHPIVIRKIREMMNAVEDNDVIIEAVYIRPENLGSIIEKIIWIECDKNIIIKRLSSDSRFSKEMVEQILSIQHELAIKPSFIDYEIDNNGSVPHLYHQLDEIINIKSG